MKRKLYLFFLLLLGNWAFADVKVIKDHNLQLNHDLYFVQIGAFSKPDPILKIKNDYNIQIFVNGKGLKVFVAGGYETLEPAIVLQETLQKKGFKDAFVVQLLSNKIQEKPTSVVSPKITNLQKTRERAQLRTIPSSTAQKSTKVIFKIALLLSALAILIVLGLISTRLYHRKNARKRKRLNLKFQNSLSKILFDEHYKLSFNEDKHFYTELFAGINIQDPFNREVLIENILTLHKNISGESSSLIKQLYVDMDLHKDSFRKLKSSKWNVKAKAIKELTEMNITEASESILKLANHRNQVIRNEAQLSILKLTNELPSTFLEDHSYSLSEWQQLNILHILLHLDINKVPDFSKYLNSPNESIVEFSIKMINFFKQLNCTEEVRKFVTHGNTKIKIEAIKTLSELEDTQSLSSIEAEVNHENKLVRNEAIKAIGKLGTDKNLLLLKELMEVEVDHDLLLSACKSMQSIGSKGDKLLEEIKFLQKANSFLIGIIKHAQDSRIN